MVELLLLISSYSFHQTREMRNTVLVGQPLVLEEELALEISMDCQQTFISLAGVQCSCSKLERWGRGIFLGLPKCLCKF
ncbi:hypothetical protein Nepgr_016021 [Nepenthes gracilis]|uniref:Uncharacterized protein n=1 Tax=Nepenthes gracilis TaxID=150966 RepID=A0AAD3SLX0_NEPGR|nr:hypothetical protein Nepgr_016021 [Nepenthes gracilis]